MSGRGGQGFQRRRPTGGEATAGAARQAPVAAAAHDAGRGNAAMAELVRGQRGAMDEDFESSLVGKNQPGQLVRLADGKRGAPHRITVHGIKASPDGIGALNDNAVKSGAKTSTFAYDDQFRRLGDSGADLANVLRAELKADPKRKYILDSHSMGSRVTLEAMRILADEGVLEGKNIEMNMIAPMLAGVTGGGAEIGTNAARLDPFGLIGALAGGARPGKDMGTGSKFQKQLEAMKLPENVKTRIFTGEADTTADATDPRFQERIRQFTGPGGHTSIPGADHETVIPAAVKRMNGGR